MAFAIKQRPLCLLQPPELENAQAQQRGTISQCRKDDDFDSRFVKLLWNFLSKKIEGAI